jgi:hypothetical protein
LFFGLFLKLIVLCLVCVFCYSGEYQIQIQVEDSLVDVDVKFDPLLVQDGETLTVDPSQIEISQIGNVVLLPSSPNTNNGSGGATNNIHVEVLSNPNNHRYYYYFSFFYFWGQC